MAKIRVLLNFLNRNPDQTQEAAQIWIPATAAIFGEAPVTLALILPQLLISSQVRSLCTCRFFILLQSRLFPVRAPISPTSTGTTYLRRERPLLEMKALRSNTVTRYVISLIHPKGRKLLLVFCPVYISSVLRYVS
jgi:hypothetical protein